jgi:putative heme-binding domain-containing protein
MDSRIGRLGIWALLAAGTLPAQHSFTPADVEEGRNLYRGNCVVCHGPDGNTVGGVDLMHNKFRSGSSNEAIEKVILSGIPGTAMPPHKFTEREAFNVVLYLRQMAVMTGDTAIGNGNADRGKTLFEGKGGCTGCHAIKGIGSRVGPDLTGIGSLRRGVELERSIVDPDAEVLAQNRTFRAVTKDGTAITGRLLNEDTFSVQLLDSKERLLSLQKANLREAAFVEKSPMPSYKDKLSAQELADLVSYLSSLKGFDAQ